MGEPPSRSGREKVGQGHAIDQQERELWSLEMRSRCGDVGQIVEEVVSWAGPRVLH